MFRYVWKKNPAMIFKEIPTPYIMLKEESFEGIVGNTAENHSRSIKIEVWVLDEIIKYPEAKLLKKSHLRFQNNWVRILRDSELSGSAHIKKIEIF